MSRIFRPLMYLLACATRQELARHVQYLKVENEILRSKLPKKLTVTPDERWRLVPTADLDRQPLDVFQMDRPGAGGQREAGEEDRPSIGPGQHRELVIKIATDNG